MRTAHVAGRFLQAVLDEIHVRKSPDEDYFLYARVASLFIFYILPLGAHKHLTRFAEPSSKTCCVARTRSETRMAPKKKKGIKPSSSSDAAATVIQRSYRSHRMRTGVEALVKSRAAEEASYVSSSQAPAAILRELDQRWFEAQQLTRQPGYIGRATTQPSPVRTRSPTKVMTKLEMLKSGDSRLLQQLSDKELVYDCILPLKDMERVVQARGQLRRGWRELSLSTPTSMVAKSSLTPSVTSDEGSSSMSEAEGNASAHAEPEGPGSTASEERPEHEADLNKMSQDQDPMQAAVEA